MSRQDRFAVECLAARRATWMEINLQALAGNLRVLKEVCRNRPIWAVVKADAYGHGAVACSRTLAEAGVHGLVVALPEEGVALRRAGITLPILLTGALPTDGAESLVRHDIAPAISAVEELEALSAGARASGRQASFHLEIDTGMTRMGVAPAELPALLSAVRRFQGCRLSTVMSHLASVSRPHGEEGQAQLRLFHECVRQVRESLGRQIPAHLASSPALCAYPEVFLDMVRPGLLLYGVCPDPALAPPRSLRPVLSFRTKVVHVRRVAAGTAVGYNGQGRTVRPCQIAVIGAGYADGLRRSLVPRGAVLLEGRRHRYIGAINMDVAQVVVESAPQVQTGQVVTLIGSDGADRLTVEDLAGWSGDSAYEWLSGLGGRVPRILLEQGQPIGLHTPNSGMVR